MMTMQHRPSSNSFIKKTGEQFDHNDRNFFYRKVRYFDFITLWLISEFVFDTVDSSKTESLLWQILQEQQ